MHRFGSTSGLLPFSHISLPKVGTIDCVLAHHVPMGAQIDDFILLSNEAERKRPIKRSLLEVVCKFWDVKGYVLVSARQRGGSSSSGGACVSYSPDHAVRLVAYGTSPELDLPSSYQFASMVSDPATVQHLNATDHLPSREEFSQRLSSRLRRTLLFQLRAMVRTREIDYSMA